MHLQRHCLTRQNELTLNILIKYRNDIIANEKYHARRSEYTSDLQKVVFVDKTDKNKPALKKEKRDKHCEFHYHIKCVTENHPVFLHPEILCRRFCKPCNEIYHPDIQAIFSWPDQVISRPVLIYSE